MAYPPIPAATPDCGPTHLWMTADAEAPAVGLVVVLMVLTELCLLQSAALRRRIKAALPPEEER
jgi:hypothetical protein